MAEKAFLEKIEIEEFGGLKNTVITPSDSLNVFTAPNETGKSTLAAFIKFIFYGFSGARKQSLSENEKELYTPWEGVKSAGSIIVNHPAGRFRVERSVIQNKETVNIYDANTGKPVFAGRIPGEVFFMLSEDSFAKILYFRQLSLNQNGDGVLAEQIQNLLFSADERMNTEKSMEKLRDAKRSLQNAHGRGIIPGLEDKYNEYDNLHADAVEVNRELTNVTSALNEKKQRINFNNKKLYELENEKANIKKYDAKKRVEAYKALESRRDEAQTEYESALNEFEGKQPPDTPYVKELIDDNARFMLLEERIGELRENISAEERTLKKIRSESPFFKTQPEGIRKNNKKAITIFAVLALTVFFMVCAVAVYSKLNDKGWSMLYVYIGYAAVFLIYMGILAVTQNRTAKKLGFKNKSDMDKAIDAFPLIRIKASEQSDRLSSLNNKYNIEIDEYNTLKKSIDGRTKEYIASDGKAGYGPVLQRMLNLTMEISSLKAEYLSLSEQLSRFEDGAGMNELEELAKGAEQPSRDRSTVEREIDFYTNALKGLKEQELDLEKRKSALESNGFDPAILYGKKEAVRERVENYRKKYASLEIAIQVLEQSMDYMKSTVSPKLAELAGGYFKYLSGEKYPSLSLTTDLYMSFESGGKTRSVDFLSSGTKDVAYMCLRFALVDLLYDTRRPFILLDDAFSRMDDERLKNMLNIIKILSEQEQVFIFTCHSREEELLRELGYKYNKLSV